MNFNLNTLAIFPHSKAKGVPKFADNFYIVEIQIVKKFRWVEDNDFETRQGHILPAIENVKGKYCLFGALNRVNAFDFGSAKRQRVSLENRMTV